MNREELSKELLKKKIPQDAYSLFGGLPNECFCLAEEKQWEVYYSERGKKTQLRKFNSEDEACEFMYKKLINIFC
ncbi:hypothetical protein [Holdemania massiliensis]|uniref:hypothetical protein n=1 Tax=Holdemania massiliensis TaxID=1468449 RepID=UPI001F06E19C|nr:hypothetical protein [Holdemania massiliensis]MCH1939870.1 hypothetical protein [Holdemania massiliensis]